MNIYLGYGRAGQLPNDIPTVQSIHPRDKASSIKTIEEALSLADSAPRVSIFHKITTFLEKGGDAEAGASKCTGFAWAGAVPVRAIGTFDSHSTTGKAFALHTDRTNRRNIPPSSLPSGRSCGQTKIGLICRNFEFPDSPCPLDKNKLNPIFLRHTHLKA